MVFPAVSRLLRPRTFLHFISLLTATEFIVIALLVNKVSGIYGILALFTGYHLSALQLSMYIYSIIVFALVCYLGPHIRTQSPLQNLALAWVYVLDTVINAAYTALFGLSWFIMLAQHLNPAHLDDGDNGPLLTPPGGKTINDTAGFTNPQGGKVDKVDVVAKPRPDKFPPGQEATLVASGDGSGLGHAIFESGSIMSVTVISTLWFVRLYMVIIVMSYARTVLRQTMAANAYTMESRRQSATQLAPNATRKSPNPDTPSTAVEPESSDPGFASMGKHARPHSPSSFPAQERLSPFDPSLPDGQGWKGKLGRILSAFPRSYWLGSLTGPFDDDDEGMAANPLEPEWARGADQRFRAHRASASRGTAGPRSSMSGAGGPLLKNPPPPPQRGTSERERRARSGTGPPPPGLDVVGPDGVVRKSESQSREGRRSGERSE